MEKSCIEYLQAERAKLRSVNRQLVEALEIAKGCTGFGYGTTPAADIIIDAALAAAKEQK